MIDHAYCPIDAAAEMGFSVVAVESGGGPPFATTTYFATVYLGENPVWDREVDPSGYPAGIQDFANHTMVLFSRRLAALLTPSSIKFTEVAAGGVDELAAVIRKVDGSNSLGAGALAEAIMEERPAWEPCPHCAATVSADRP